MTIPHLSDGKMITLITLHDVNALITDTHSQKIIISGEGIARQEYLFTPQNKLQNLTINLPLTRNEDVALKFEMPNAICPSALDPSNLDPRKLSIDLSTVRVAFFIPPVKRPLPQRPQTIPQPAAAAKPAVEKPTAQDKSKMLLLAAATKIEAFKQRLDTDYKPQTPKRMGGPTLHNFLDDEEVVKEEEWGYDDDVNNKNKPVVRTQPVIEPTPKIIPGKLKINGSNGNLLSHIRAQHKEYEAPELKLNVEPPSNPTRPTVQVADASVTSAFQNLLKRQRKLAAGEDDEDTPESDDLD